MGNETPSTPLGFNKATAWKLVAAIAAGIGVIGFVTAVGGAVTYVPFWRAKVPTDFALAAKSKTELLTVGATRLVLFGLIAAVFIAIFAGLRADRVPKRDWHWLAEFAPFIILVVLGLAVAEQYFPPNGEHPTTFWILAAFALVGVLLTLFVGWTTRSFVWLCVALTLAIAVFGSATSIARTWHEPKIQSFALLRKGEDVGLRGFYVAETSNFVHLALADLSCEGGENQLDKPTGSVRILVIPRSEVVALSVGPKQSLCHAWNRSSELLAELVETRPDKAVGLPRDASPRADGSISVPVGRVTHPDRLKIGDAIPLPRDPGSAVPFPMSFDPACKRKLGTAGTAQLGVRITTVNTQKNKEQRSFVVSGAQVWVKPFPAGLYSPASTLTGPRGFACLTLKPSKHRDSAVSTLVLFVRAMDPKRKDEVSVRRLMRVRLGIDAIGSGGGSSNPTK